MKSRGLRIFIRIVGILLLLEVGRMTAMSQSWRFEVVHRVPTNKKVVALTFDDGPNPEFTPQILAELKKHKVKATFFMIGREMEMHPDIVKDVLDAGDVIGNHTYSHPHDIESLNDLQIAEELDKCERIIEKMTGKRAYLFRPPRGLVDGKVLNIADEGGYTTVLWTVCADHHDAPTPKDMAKRVLEHVRPGCIVLAHDGTFKSRWKDVEATPAIIEELKKAGYKFVTVPELLKMTNGAK